jgi:hypothetical protein
VQLPPQRRNDDPFLAFWVSTTLVPTAKVALHFPGQEIPAGWLVTPPLPRTTTTNVGSGATARGVAAPIVIVSLPELGNAASETTPSSSIADTTTKDRTVARLNTHPLSVATQIALVEEHEPDRQSDETPY